MRKSCTYGSARGAPSNGRPYRNRRAFIAGLGGAAGVADGGAGAISGVAANRSPKKSLSSRKSRE